MELLSESDTTCLLLALTNLIGIAALMKLFHKSHKDMKSFDLISY